MKDGQGIYYLWLALKSRQCIPRIGEMVHLLGGIEKAYEAGEKQYLETGLVKKNELPFLCNKSLNDAKEMQKLCSKAGIDLIAQSDSDFPELLKKIYNPPLLLFVRGDLSGLNDRIVLSMVGTRQCSGYGSQVAEMLARGLAAAGAVIVSGMALGIDAYAHKGALAADGKTIAVIGSGLDIIYPMENTKLYHKIAETGAVISEYPLGTRAFKENFPARNRIIAGLSVGTIVVEAPENSGALITARYALDEGRDLFAVPGNLFYAQGSNKLLKECAKLVTEPVDVLEEYADNFYDRLEHSILAKRSKRTIKREPVATPVGADFESVSSTNNSAAEQQERFAAEIDLTDVEKTVKAALSREPKTLNILVQATDLSASQVSAALMMLELKKHAFSLPGGRYYKE